MEKQVSSPFVRIAAASSYSQVFVHDNICVKADCIVGIIRYDEFDDFMGRGIDTFMNRTSYDELNRYFHIYNGQPIFLLILEESCWRSLNFEHAYVLAHPDSRETIAHLQMGTAQHLRDFAVILEHAPRLLRLVKKELEQSNVEAEHSRKKSRLEKGRE